MIFTGKRNSPFPAPYLEKRGRGIERKTLIYQRKSNKQVVKTRGKNREKSSTLPFFFFQHSKKSRAQWEEKSGKKSKKKIEKIEGRRNEFISNGNKWIRRNAGWSRVGEGVYSDFTNR